MIISIPGSVSPNTAGAVKSSRNSLQIDVAWPFISGMELWVLALNSQTETTPKSNLWNGTARRWNYTFLNTDTTNPRRNGESLIHLVPKKPGMVIWSWKAVMQSLHNMERFMEWLTCYRRTPKPVLVLAANAKETLKHTLDFSSLMFEVKHGPKCSAGLGPICCTTIIKKKKKFLPKFLLCDICVKMLGFKCQLVINFVSVPFLSSPRYETTLSGIR